eukprot:3364037-Rhodomonas_salina.2
MRAKHTYLNGLQTCGFHTSIPGFGLDFQVSDFGTEAETFQLPDTHLPAPSRGTELAYQMVYGRQG